MVNADLAYVERLIRSGTLCGPVLELGTGYEGETCRSLVQGSGLLYYGTDLQRGRQVDFVADFERPADMAVFNEVGPFGAILVLNVLEHTFDPIRVLDNAATLLKPGGALVLLTPAVWPLHSFPFDSWRVLPDFYREYARRRGMRLLHEYFEYIGVGKVEEFRDTQGNPSLPPPSSRPWGLLFGRAVHKCFNTFGRSMFQPSHVAVGVVLLAPDVSPSPDGQAPH